MHTFLQVPEWLATAVVGGILAALGYVGKLLIELYQAYKDRQRKKRSKLIELQSLLRATRVAFVIQNEHAQNLTNSIEANYPQIFQRARGYEEKISRAFHSLNPDELELHLIIRSITINALFPLNKSVVEWLRGDTDFKVAGSKDKTFSGLAEKLSILESHLLLWIAKYEAWIPDHKEHALVYMADEKHHGLGFPEGVDELVDEAAKKS